MGPPIYFLARRTAQKGLMRVGKYSFGTPGISYLHTVSASRSLEDLWETIENIHFITPI